MAPALRSCRSSFHKGQARTQATRCCPRRSSAPLTCDAQWSALGRLRGALCPSRGVLRASGSNLLSKVASGYRGPSRGGLEPGSWSPWCWRRAPPSSCEWGQSFIRHACPRGRKLSRNLAGLQFARGTGVLVLHANRGLARRGRAGRGAPARALLSRACWRGGGGGRVRLGPPVPRHTWLPPSLLRAGGCSFHLKVLAAPGFAAPAARPGTVLSIGAEGGRITPLVPKPHWYRLL